MGIQNIKITLFTLFLLLNVTLFSNSNNEFKTIDEKINSLYEFTVDTISPEDLNEILDRVYLIDTRLKKESSVSRIRNANFLDYKSFDIKSMDNIPKDTIIVLYCTIGYRSEKIGELLINAGYKNVYNLYGGILNWVNKGFAVYNNDIETNRVHTYSKSWSKYLTNRDIEGVN